MSLQRDDHLITSDSNDLRHTIIPKVYRTRSIPNIKQHSPATAKKSETLIQHLQRILFTS